MYLDDEPRWIRLAVAWSPNPRNEPVQIVWAVNGAGRPPLHVTHSPWPTREIAVRPGDVLTLRATQTTPGVLSCSLSEHGEIVAHDVLVDKPGTIECTVHG